MEENFKKAFDEFKNIMDIKIKRTQQEYFFYQVLQEFLEDEIWKKRILVWHGINEN